MAEIAKVSFSVAFLESVLPLGSKILSVRENEIHNVIKVLIANQGFEDVHDGQLPPSRTLVVYMSHDPLVSRKVEYAT